jgi:hypothetical protein
MFCAATCFVYANFMSPARMECFDGLGPHQGPMRARRAATSGSRVGAEAGVARLVLIDDSRSRNSQE